MALSLKQNQSKLFIYTKTQATFALKFEPWILDTANSSSQVHGYQKITFGDGATLKTENHVQCKNNGTLVPSQVGMHPEIFGLTMNFFQSGVLKVPCQI